jgi:hypothetical protein
MGRGSVGGSGAVMGRGSVGGSGRSAPIATEWTQAVLTANIRSLSLPLAAKGLVWNP